MKTRRSASGGVNVSPARNEYISRINRVMDFIETRLSEPLPLERVADVACFSKFHFHRIFQAYVGETPGQFIQRLRLEKAVRLLCINQNTSITGIAMECGFSDSAAFSRAFKAVYGISPGKYRETGLRSETLNSNLSTIKSKRGQVHNEGDRYDTGISHILGRLDMPERITDPFPAENVQVIDKPEMTVAYVRHTGPYFGDEKLFQRLFETLYRWAVPRGLVQRGVTEEIIIYHDDPETVQPDKLRVSCCITVPPDTGVSGEVGTMVLPAGKYAEARFILDATKFAGAWNWVFGVWLPDSGYQPDDALCYEKYLDHDTEAEIDGTTGRTFVVDICVPVKPL
jgi:AraC family transcriptional regulator